MRGKAGDRPRVIPKGAVNFAFLGQFAETVRAPCLEKKSPDANRVRTQSGLRYQFR